MTEGKSSLSPSPRRDQSSRETMTRREREGGTERVESRKTGRKVMEPQKDKQQEKRTLREGGL